MTTASQPGLFNFQAFTSLGTPAASYRLYTYSPSTTTHKDAYTDEAASVPHTYTSDGSGGQYIALDARGELPAPLYLTAGGYDMCLKTAAGATVWTRRAITVEGHLADATNALYGAGMVGYSPSLSYASGSVGKALVDRGACITDFGADATGVSDSTTAIQTALNLGGAVYVPAGTFLYSALTIKDGNQVYGSGTLKRKTTGGLAATEVYCIDATSADNWSIRGVTLDGNKAGQTGSAGFKVSGLLIRGATNFDIAGCRWKNWHEDAIEITSSTQSAPSNAYTEPSDVADTIYRGTIIGNLFMDCGRNVDDGGGYSTSHTLQIGSTTAQIIVVGNGFWNCIGGVQAAAYNRHLVIANNSGYIDSATYTYAGDFVDLEQLSTQSVVTGNTCRGFRNGYNIESPIGAIITDNYADDVLNGISAFASNVGATVIDLGELVIANNRIKCRGTSAGTFGIRAVKSSGNDAYNIVITGNSVEAGETGIYISGVTGGAASGNYVKGSKTGINVTGAVKYHIAGNYAKDCTTEGIYLGAANNGLTVSANKASGCSYGCDVAAGQTDVRIYDNDFDGSNSTYDFRITTYSNIKHDNNRFSTHSGTIKTISGATFSVQYTGPTSYLTNGGATTVTAITGGRIGEAFRFVATNANTTLQHGTNIFLRAHANLAMAASDAITLATDDGTHWYEC